MQNPAPPPPQNLVNAHACAKAVGMSVSWLVKDRRGKRVVPFYRIGGAVRYDLQRVREALEHAGGGDAS